MPYFATVSLTSVQYFTTHALLCQGESDLSAVLHYTCPTLPRWVWAQCSKTSLHMPYFATVSLTSVQYFTTHALLCQGESDLSAVLHYTCPTLPRWVWAQCSKTSLHMPYFAKVSLTSVQYFRQAPQLPHSYYFTTPILVLKFTNKWVCF